MKIRFRNILLILVFFLCTLFTNTRADEDAKTAKDIISKWESTIILVKLIVKQTIIVQGKEVNKMQSKIEIQGTVIDSTGLILVSNLETDPSSFFENMSRGLSDDNQFKMDSEISDIKIKFSKENEVEGKIILKDKDLDIAFIRPTTKLLKPVPCLNIKDNIQPELLDKILSLNRLSKIANEELNATIGRINTVIHKPRTFYIGEISELGAPVFSLEKGKQIGIVVSRTVPAENTFGSMFGSGGDRNFLRIILPINDVIEIMEQIPKE